MTEGARCERCLAGVIHRGQGKLDQSGNTYLPTTVWTCDVCGLASYEPALGTRWRADDPGPEPEERRSPFEIPTRRAA